MDEFYYDEGFEGLFVEVDAIPVSGGEPLSAVYTGVVLFCETDFALVAAAPRSCIGGDIESFHLRLKFVDNTKLVVSTDQIRYWEHFIFISCIPKEGKEFDTQMVKAVEYCETKLEPRTPVHTIYLMDFQSPMNLTSGEVGRSEDLFFHHNSQMGCFTKDGSPVFVGRGQFVGLCYAAPCGILAAATVLSISNNLSDLFKIKERGIDKILQCIYVSAVPKNAAEGRLEDENITRAMAKGKADVFLPYQPDQRSTMADSACDEFMVKAKAADAKCSKSSVCVVEGQGYK